MDMHTFSSKEDARTFAAFAKDHSNVKSTKVIPLADGFLVIIYL